MDNFEKHIRENAAEFEDYQADRSKMWVHIKTELKTEAPKVIPLWRSPLLRIAATVLILLGVSAFIGLSVFSNIGHESENGFASQELQDIDMHYKNLVSFQVQLVQDHPKLSEEDKREFLSFMDELDEEYQLLKLEMEKNLGNARILEAIIGNYKKRIELIENLLKQINDSKTKHDDYGYIL